MFHIFSFSKKIVKENKDLILEHKLIEKIIELERKKCICEKYHLTFDLKKIEFTLNILYEILQK